MSRARHLFIAIAGAPVAWVFQMSLSEPLAADACYPHQTPLPMPRWEGLTPLLIVISFLCLVVGVLSGLIAWHSWRQAWPEQSLRFLALLGVMSSFIFIVAILLTTCTNLLVLPCHPWF